MNEDQFVQSLIAFFTPKALKAFDDGIAWWEFKEAVKVILEEKAAERTSGLPECDKRPAMRAFRNRIHPRVLGGLERIYPSAELQ